MKKQLLCKSFNRKCLIKRVFISFMLSVFVVSGLCAQELTVKGVVLDAKTNEPLPGVSVILKGKSNIGVTTNLDGVYGITLSSSKDAVLVFNYLGYRAVEKSVNNQKTIDVLMEEDATDLDEVVVVGYGVQKKINLTGSISTVGSKKIESRAVTNLSTALSGLASGVQVTQGRGNPGDEDVSIRFRGTTSFNASNPLVLVDGIAGDMSVLNTEDVESITFLKDAASAAIYGSRAAAGVILVTTKKGKKEKPTVTITSMYAREKAITSLKFLSNMPDYMKYHNMAQINNTGTSSWYSEEIINEWTQANANPNGIYTDPTTGNKILNSLAYPNTDWAQMMFQPTDYHKHSVSVSGGSDASTYLLSVGYQDNPGTLKNTGLQRYNIRANVETRVADFITLGTQTYGSKEFKEPGDIEMKFLPQAYPGINPTYQGKYGASEDPNMASMNNILRSVAFTGGERQHTRINTAWYANVDIWKGLSAEAKFNYSEYQREDETYDQNLPSYRFRLGTGDEAIVENKPNIGNAKTSRYAYGTSSYTTNLFLRYSGKFGKHDISAFVGNEQYYYVRSGFDATKKGLLDWGITDITSASEVDNITSNVKDHSKSDYAMRSYFGRINYVYNDKYLFEANLRSDASSRFAPDKRGDLFPSFSVGWRISEESFFAPASQYVNSLKLRASYGSLGNTVSSNYDWQEQYKKQEYVFNQVISNGLVLSKLGNINLMWEKTTTTNLGFDAAFLNNRLNLEFDYYYRKTMDILTDPPIYLTLGTVESAKSNSGDMQNKGIDISMSWNDKIGKDFWYSVGLNLNYNTNEVTKYKGRLVYGPHPTQVDMNGKPIWSYLNLDGVSKEDYNRRLVEGHMYNEYFLRKPYSGNGSYTNADGTVNPLGGPRDGMIRTKADLDWAKAMVAAGYNFNNKKIGTGTGQIWYGEMLLSDLNGDGIYGDSNDREFTGKSNAPKFTFGFNISAEWKGIDMSAMWAGRLGSYHYIRTKGANHNQVKEITDALPAATPTMYYSFNMKESMTNPDYDPAKDPNANINAKHPRLYAADSQLADNSFYLYNTSFLKLKSLQIGYTLPKSWMNTAKIGKCRVFVAGENLLTIQSNDFPAVDPELGDDISVYPTARMLSCGINLTF